MTPCSRSRPTALAWPVALLVVCAGGVSISACHDEGWNGQVPAPDPQLFAQEVYPVLMRDCAFNDCHGRKERFFQVFGPSRLRANPRTEQNAPVDPAEMTLSYDRARSMLVSTGPITRSLLLLKPLEQAAGGVGHLGADDYKRNVYQSTQDPGYATLLRWAQTAGSSVR